MDVIVTKIGVGIGFGIRTCVRMSVRVSISIGKTKPTSAGQGARSSRLWIIPAERGFDDGGRKEYQ
jgi:hypothetical protein